jgi:uncharacterized protein
VPSMVERTLIRPPAARLGPITPHERQAIVNVSPVAGLYDTAVDRESAYEILAQRALEATDATVEVEAEQESSGGFLGTIFGTTRKRGQTLTPSQRVAREVTRTVVTRTAGQVAANVGKQFGGSIGGSVGRAIVRGVLGGMLRR